MVFPYKWFRLPFAVAGTKTAIPDPTQGDGSVSYNEGFGADYSLDPATNPSALLIPRDKTNELYYDITQALQYIQSGQIPAWIDASTNGGSSYSYAINTLVLYTDGVIYLSLAAANTTTPGTDLSKWAPLSLTGVPVGQCRLSVVSGVSLKLSPFNGNRLTVNGANVPIPSAGVTIANTGLVANTTYYVYAAITGGALVLELSTTGHSTNAANGIEVKTGDATRTLVGMIRTSNNTPGQFLDAGRTRFCANWFNRRTVSGFNLVSGVVSSSSGVIVDLMPSNHAEFLCWADDVVEAELITATTNSNAGSSSRQVVTFDGLALATAPEQLLTAPVGGAYTNACIPPAGLNLSEGYHYVTLGGYAGGNTASWNNPQLSWSANI